MKNQALFEMEAKDEKEGIDRLCQWHGRQLHQVHRYFIASSNT